VAQPIGALAFAIDVQAAPLSAVSGIVAGTLVPLAFLLIEIISSVFLLELWLLCFSS
jgi:hypothetical protein